MIKISESVQRKAKNVQDSSSNALKEDLAIICFLSLDVPGVVRCVLTVKHPVVCWSWFFPALADHIHVFPALHLVTSPLVV